MPIEQETEDGRKARLLERGKKLLAAAGKLPIQGSFRVFCGDR